MNITEIADVAARVLYLEDGEQIGVSESLFHEYGMSWLDFLEFACELQAAAHKAFDPDQLWPVDAMMNQAAFYRAGAWTDAGRAELARIFHGHAAVPAAGTVEELRALFSVAYVAHRLRSL